jgi:hypothetical protein
VEFAYRLTVTSIDRAPGLGCDRVINLPSGMEVSVIAKDCREAHTLSAQL